MRFKNILGILAVSLALLVATPARAGGKVETVEGYVLDSACAFVKNLTKPVSAECAVACAKAGSPLVILSDDGTIYWPISDRVPAEGQNSRLMKFAAQRVKVTGTVYTRGGAHALVIQEIRAARGGH